MINPVVQEETTGCGIASVANIVGKTYRETRVVANSLGIYAEDETLWSDTQYVRNLLSHFGFTTSAGQSPFNSWNELPDIALLAIKHYRENEKEFWHWVVFKRLNDQARVLDSASYLPSNVRTDFNAIQPKWFIEVLSI